MEIGIQKRIVTELIDKQFMPEVVANLRVFLDDYKSKIEAEAECRIITGYRAQYPIIPSLDLRPAQRQLISNLSNVFTTPKN